MSRIWNCPRTAILKAKRKSRSNRRIYRRLLLEGWPERGKRMVKMEKGKMMLLLKKEMGIATLVHLSELRHKGELDFPGTSPSICISSTQARHGIGLIMGVLAIKIKRKWRQPPNFIDGAIPRVSAGAGISGGLKRLVNEHLSVSSIRNIKERLSGLLSSDFSAGRVAYKSARFTRPGRFWPNDYHRMYVLEVVAPCIPKLMTFR